MSNHVNKLPTVVVVGRTNVGKSTLFNRLVGDKKSITLDEEGVTRDYIEEPVSWDNKNFIAVDTGGLSYKKGLAGIEKMVQEKGLSIIEKAGIILFVCDAKTGVTQEDLHIARMLRQSKKPIILLINKSDNRNALMDFQADFFKLGFKDMILMSAIHGTGMSTLLERIIELLPEGTEEADKPSYRIVIVGKPNVGKSSLMNLLIKQERSIVSDVAGTTREAITENIFYLSDLIQVTDTAGVRKKSSINEDLETLMAKSSLHSIREASVVILMVDASQGAISDQELKLLFYAYELKKPLLVLFNKTDLLDEYTRSQLTDDLDRYEFILKKLPVLNISCLTKKNVMRILHEVKALMERCATKINSTELNELVRGELERKPLYYTRTLLRLFKIRTITDAEIPTFVLHVNYPQWFGPSQLAFIENVIRKNYELKGCPMQFIVKDV